MQEDHNQPSKASDEIDLGQIFNLIERGFNKLFRGFLRVFLFFKRNLLWIAGLLIIGVVAGILLKLVVQEKQKLDVIITPNLNAQEYLEDIVSELDAQIGAQDEAFLQELGLDVNRLKGFEVQLVPLRDEKGRTDAQTSTILEILQEFDNSEAIADIIRAELQDRTTRDHRITFYFKDPEIGEEYARKILDYINSNNYYAELNEIYRINAETRIRRNDSLVAQIDILVRNYSEKMLKEPVGSEGRLLLENQETLNVPALLELKQSLIQSTEEKRLELLRREDAISIINFGKPHTVKKAFFGKWVVQIPLILFGAFLLIALLRYLNRKAAQMSS